jgi:hypothetical protein
MKNIHILPTDKPSRIFYLAGNLHLEMGQLITPKDYQNIYITSDMEEIKEGDYYIAEFGSLDRPIHKHIGEEPKGDYKKIILTTDQDLIENGVQAIDDEFLEWFIKNSSCEWIEVILIDVEQPKPLYPNGNHKGERVWIEQYKIIIPQLCKIGCDKLILNGINSICCGDKDYKIIIPQEEPKQETLEEAAKKQWGNVHRTGVLGFIEGAKWQEERMYSEEEVYHILCEHTAELFKGSKLTLTEWFEQFKKK